MATISLIAIQMIMLLFVGAAAQSPDIEISDIHVSLTLLSHEGVGLRVRAEVRNGGRVPVLVAAAPRRSDGSYGPYFELGDDQTLVVSYRLFKLPAYTLFVNNVGVELRRLVPGAHFVEEFAIRFPMRETMPPYGNALSRYDIEIERVKAIKAELGILPDDMDIEAVLTKKVRPFWTAGQEVIKDGRNQGKLLWEVQECASSQRLPLIDR